MFFRTGVVGGLREVPAYPGGPHGGRVELADGGGHGGEREHGPHAQGVGQRERRMRAHALRAHLHSQVHAPPQKQVSERGWLQGGTSGCRTLFADIKLNVPPHY